jgi:tripartite-type tricarboxylate transporter receptor subunit TctC
MKKIICLLSAFLFFGVLADTNMARESTIRIVVPVPVGGSFDRVARSLQQPLQVELGRPVYVENKPGGNAVIGARELINHQGKDPVLLVSGIGVFINNTQIDGITDMTPIYYLGYVPEVIVARPAFRYDTLADLVKNSQERITLATINQGGDTSSILVSSTKKSNIDLIYYKGGQQAMVDLMAGVLDLAPANISTAKPLIDANKIKALGVTGARRHIDFPNLPTYSEQGINIPSSLQFYVWVNKGAAPAQIEKIVTALDVIVQRDDYKKDAEFIGLVRPAIRTSVTTHFADSKQRIYSIINK